MKTYTAFCQDVSGEGGIWIESFEARGLRSAIKDARNLCAEAWGCAKNRVHVLGIAEGEVTILHWEDEAPPDFEESEQPTREEA